MFPDAYFPTSTITCYFFFMKIVAWNNSFWPGLTPFGLLLWQAEADIDMTLSASPTTAVGQKALALAKRRYSMVNCFLISPTTFGDW